MVLSILLLFGSTLLVQTAAHPFAFADLKGKDQSQRPLIRDPTVPRTDTRGNDWEPQVQPARSEKPSEQQQAHICRPDQKDILSGGVHVDGPGSDRDWKHWLKSLRISLWQLGRIHWSGIIDTGRASSEDRRLSPHEIPDYVFEYAPYVHLFSDEQFWPCDIANHLIHTTPHLNYTPLQGRAQPPNLTNLDQLNHWNRGRFVFLKSDDNVEERPKWLGGQSNIPSKYVENEEAGSQTSLGGEESNLTTLGGRSDAPAVLIVVDKGDGIIDAFWFFFYSYNLGNMVLNVRFGNHVGDWEHTMVRFKHGVPQVVYFSEHSFGDAYTYEAVEKIGKRPVVYSATGTHAMYPTPGIHQYVLPWGLLRDVTDRGPLWDPSLNALMYNYDHRDDKLRPADQNPEAPTQWFYFNGHWGDKFYPMDDPRQYEFAGQYHYVNGPSGPRFKNLGRQLPCQSRRNCHIKEWLMEDKLPRKWVDPDEGDEVSAELLDMIENGL